MAPPTVVSLKQDFLSIQTRLLSQPLAPSRAWRAANNNHEESLPEKAIDDALLKLNQRLQQHSRRAYAPQATRHVAEQIDQLYWNAAVAASEGGDNDDEDPIEGLTIGADLASPATITSLPLSWDAISTQQASAYPLEASRYADLAAQLQTLSSQRSEAAARVARLQRMRALLAPFDDAAGVQENLVTRNGEVEAELQRMRMLLARVGGRVSQLREQDVPVDAIEVVEDVEVDERRKVGLLLERF
ncbi:kinetochore Sim4 complex subunit Fta4 [Lasiosphaeris hirsuta]|uniref:Kinetochore Sim4 complex subunit Fta4 n=1 Tax=Lasiosphaeris hirsuta TaxID=260670 RepID=A0AA40DYN4_9PEZI|nr:kinetochore Sim4 complex subunit Fta4 [Lasiosphaeris hirsuta]